MLTPVTFAPARVVGGETRTMAILQMTPEDVELGVRSNCRDCPLSRLVNRYILPHLVATIAINVVRIYERPYTEFQAQRPVHEAYLSIKAFAYRLAVDDGIKTVPVALPFDIPSELLKPTELWQIEEIP
jgi:hypothetical protein